MRIFYPTKMEPHGPSLWYLHLFGGIRRSIPSYAQGFGGLSFSHSSTAKSRGLLRRRIKERLRECAFFTVIGLALAGAVREAKAQENLKYEITKIVIPDPNANFSGATHINDYGEVVGFYGKKELWRKAFLYKNEIIKDLGKSTLYYDFKTTPIINDLGDVVVNKEASGYGRSSIYSLGKTTDINFWSRGINNKGEVVGFFYLYSGGQTIELIHSYEGTMYNSINDYTQIVGSWSGITGAHHAVILENRVDWTILSPDRFGEALDINNNGKTVGYFYFYGFPTPFACLWEKDLQNKWLVRQLDTVKSTAWAINDNGQVVGCSNIAPLNDLLPENADATLYQDGKKINLNDFLPESSEFERLICALDINNKGQIVGYGEGRNEPGSQYAFVMTPIPQPSADLYEDGIVDFKDLAEFASQWLESNQR